MDITHYTAFFHDGSIFSIRHIGNNITILMGSAQMDKEDKKDDVIFSLDNRTQGKLHLEGVTEIIKNEKEPLRLLNMKYPDGKILDLEIEENSVEMAVNWKWFFMKNPVEDFSVITIKAEKVWWENIPRQKTTLSKKAIELDFPKPKALSMRPEVFLEEWKEPENYYWNMLVITAELLPSEKEHISHYWYLVNNSEQGLKLSWDELKTLLARFSRFYTLVLVGSKDPSSLHRYEDEEEMKEKCDLVIQLIEGGFLGVFSKDEEFISRLAEKVTKLVPDSFPRKKRS